MHCYLAFHRIYDSSLKLNPIIEEHGYVFEAFSYSEFGTKFNRVISLGAIVEDPMQLSTLSFVHPTFDFHVTAGRPMVLLRSIERTRTIRQKDYDFKNKLINILRLYKPGMIQSVMQFTYDIATKSFGEAGFDSKHKSTLVEEYVIEDSDVSNLSLMLSEGLNINELSKLAFDSFNLSYSIDNKPLKYITLITALESLFNIGRDQIAHTVSRHLSVLIATSKEEFYDIYKTMKKLYDFRSRIVHGSSVNDKELDDKLSTLEDLLRKALNKTIKVTLTKDELFKELNARGFS